MKSEFQTIHTRENLYGEKCKIYQVTFIRDGIVIVYIVKYTLSKHESLLATCVKKYKDFYLYKEVLILKADTLFDIINQVSADIHIYNNQNQ
jgi:hypothetical protein